MIVHLSVASIVKGDKFNKKNDLKRESIKNIPYASIVGSLTYTQVCTRHDIITCAVGMLGQYQSNLGINH